MRNVKKHCAHKTESNMQSIQPKTFENSRLYRINQLARTKSSPGLIPAGTSTIWFWVSNNQFPKPIKIGPRTTVWRGEDLNEWLNQQIKASRESVL